MAKRSARASRARGGSRPAQAKSKRKPTTAGAEVEVVEEAGGVGIEAGIAIATCILLLVAILFVDAHLGRYGSGLFM